MQTLKGTVSNLNRSTRIRGGSGTPLISTNVATFELAGQSIVLQDRSPIIISDGDEIAVAGEKAKNGAFKATAYRNITRGVHGGNSGVVTIIVSIIFLILSVFLCLCSFLPSLLPLLAGDKSSSSILALLCILPLSLIPVTGSGIFLYFGIKQRQAWLAV